MLGFGCHVLAYDVKEQESMTRAGVVDCPLDEVLSKADVISLHCPLNEQNTLPH